MRLYGGGRGLTAIDPALHASEARLRAVLGATGAAIAIGDIDGRLLEVNPQIARMFGAPAADLVGRNVLELLDPQQRQRFASGHSPVRLERRYQRASGDAGWAMFAFSAVPGEPAYLVVVGEDVTELRAFERELHYDPLTGLPNRMLLYRHLETALSDPDDGARIGLCFIDLDEFKTVNDTLGHGSGDRLLIAAAGRLRERVEAAGHFVARAGGDEFVIVARTSGPAELTTLAETLLEDLAKPVRLNGHELSLSASIGIVEQPVAGSSAEELLRAADATLHLAKADGRARWAVYDARRNARQVLRYGLTGRLPGALERGEFALQYQPLVSLVDNRLRGAEALLRWNHPDLGTLSPNTFVPVAERSGLIGMLGRWVLRESCAQAAKWQARFPDETPLVSVNVSGRQCTDPQLHGEVTAALADSGLAPANLQLELTETVLMQSYDRPSGRPVRALRALADLGVRIVIDDFGIGYSNLAYLRHLPVHGLKLAGSFMVGIRAPESDRVDEQIVETVIGLAHTLGMTVTAEGVETADQAARLAALGCDLAQGWHFGRPGAGSTIEALAG